MFWLRLQDTSASNLTRAYHHIKQLQSFRWTFSPLPFTDLCLLQQLQSNSWCWCCFNFGCRVRRPASRWMRSSTSNAQRSIRRTWKTFSGRQRRELWPSIENRGIIRGRRNVSFCECIKRTAATRTLPLGCPTQTWKHWGSAKLGPWGATSTSSLSYQKPTDYTTGKAILQVAESSLWNPLSLGSISCDFKYFFFFLKNVLFLPQEFCSL